MDNIYMLRVVFCLMIVSVLWLSVDIVKAEWKNSRVSTCLKGGLLLINMVLLVWIVCNREWFHWNYDIATGRPVDHYSTYGKCVLCAGVAVASSIMSLVVRLKKMGVKPWGRS